MSQTEPIRVVLIDDHPHIHEAVSIVLSGIEDIKLVGQGGTGEEALQLSETLKPDIILMDVVMPGMGGVGATQAIRQWHPQVRILVLSSFQDDETVRAMLRSGADGYILKGSLAHDLADTIRTTCWGKAVFSSEVTQALVGSARPAAAPQENFHLTERELEVLILMAQGMNNGEIAAALFISQSTVKFHLNNILLKMKVKTRAEAIVLAAKNNLV